MRSPALFAVACTGVLAATGVALVIVGEPAPPATIPEVTFDGLDPRAPWVRIRGTAHYASTITQRVPATLLAPERTYYLFAFFPEYAAEAREVPLLIRTQRAPERVVSFETMTIEGRLVPLTRDRIPGSTEALLSERTDYFFADDVKLLEPVRILHEDGVWEEPR